MYTTVRRRRSLEQQLEKLKTKQKMEEEKVVRISYFLFVVVVVLLGLPRSRHLFRERNQNFSRKILLVSFLSFLLLFFVFLFCFLDIVLSVPSIKILLFTF